MAYAAWSVVAGEQPTAAKWNILGTNDASFNDGTGIGTGAIATAALAAGAVTSTKFAPTIQFNNNTNYPSLTSAAYVDVTGSSFNVTVPTAATKLIIISTISGRWTGAPSVAILGNVLVNAVQMQEARVDIGVSGGTWSLTIMGTASPGVGTFAIKNQVKSTTGTLDVMNDQTIVLLVNS